jgi:hypothetical protein
MKQTAFAVLLLMLWASAVFGTSKAYDIVPYKGCVSQAPAYVNVSQYFRNTLDDITMVSFWVGDAGDTNSFSVEIKDSITDDVVADTHGIRPAGSWSWLNMPANPYMGREPIRGRTYKVVVTRQSGQPISFAYCDTNPIAV